MGFSPFYANFTDLGSLCCWEHFIYARVQKFLYKNFQWPDRCQKRKFLFSKSTYAGVFLCRRVYVMLIFNPKKNPPRDSRVIYLWISNIIYLLNTIDTHSVGSTQKEIPNLTSNHGKTQIFSNYRESSIIGTSITVILAIPRFKKKSQVIWLSGLFTNKSSQYSDPKNRRLGFFFDYGELFLDLVIPIIEDPL